MEILFSPKKGLIIVKETATISPLVMMILCSKSNAKGVAVDAVLSLIITLYLE